LFKTEYERLLAYTRYQLADLKHIEAEDVLHEVAFRVFSKIDFDTVVENVSAYIYRSIKHRIIDIIRKPKRTVSLQSLKEKKGAHVETEKLISGNESVEKIMEREELYDKLHEAIDSLSFDDQKIIIATEFEGKTMKELSQKWGIPQGTLLSRRHRALAKLYKILEQYRINL
jgi:RNA polymerase sigma-70 factor (ECF subfamily)